MSFVAYELKVKGSDAMGFRVFLSCLVLIFGLFGSRVCAEGGASPSALEVLRLYEKGLGSIFEKASPAVVFFEVERRREYPEVDPDSSGESSLPKGGGGAFSAEPRGGGDAPARVEGSGFIVRENGVILTNHHVVAAAQSIAVRLRDGRRFPARVLGSDERTDVAVVQIDATRLPVLQFADSDVLNIGQFVAAIGAPFSQEWSFTSGIISGKGRTRLLAPTNLVPLFEDYIQTDAFISPGHSGGPLLDLDGRVIGMNTLITRVERGLAFAVPSNILQRTLDQILASGKVSHPWLGVRVETLGETPALKERLAAAGSGAVVLCIEPDGPAFRTDLRPADVIVALDGKSVSSALEFQRELFNKRAGSQLQLSVWRQNVRKSIAVVAAEVPDSSSRSAQLSLPSTTKDLQNERFGLTLREVKPRGVRVEAVDPGGLAAHSELVVGDVITDVEGRLVRSSGDCLAAIRMALSKGGNAGAILQVERQGRRTFVLLRAR